MIFTIVLFVGSVLSGKTDLASDTALMQWVGQASAQIEARLGEKATVSFTAGGTDHLQTICHYANAQLVVWYNENGAAVKVLRATK